MEFKRIGNKIAEARKKANITQAQLAQKLFISPQAVGKWERGESMPDIATFGRLAEILLVDLNYFSDNHPSAANESPFNKAQEGLDDTEQMEGGDAEPSHSQDRNRLTNFVGSNLPESDFAGTTVRKGKFVGSDLHGANFSGAELTGSSFMGSDMREANFDGANLTDCSFYALDLTGASFHQSILVRTKFNALALEGAKFVNATLTDVKLSASDLRNVVFEHCIFEGVDFDKSDMRGLCMDGQTFIGVTFDNSSMKEASFRGATFKNVAFRATFALTNRFYRSIKTIIFDGATMDKLTFNTLKGMGADLSKVTTV